MQTVISCARAAGGKHNFYMTAGGVTYYLFTQDFRRGVDNYFGKGVGLKEAVDRTKSNRDSAVLRTMEKIPLYIRYLERENKIAVLERTKYCGRTAQRAARAYYEYDR